MNTPQLTPQQVNRFWSHVTKTPTCWIWHGSKNKDNYGVYSANGVTYLAHRLAWLLIKGSIPDGKIIMHSCDNPACCNPEHLSIGTHMDNAIDRLSKNRGAKGESINTAKLTESDVLKIRELFADGVSGLALSVEYDVRPSTIYRISNGEYWQHVGGPRTRRPYNKRPLRSEEMRHA